LGGEASSNLFHPSQAQSVDPGQEENNAEVMDLDQNGDQEKKTKKKRNKKKNKKKT